MNSKITEKINSDEILQEIINNFENEIYLVGGAVRDFLTGKSTNDRDLLILDEDAREFFAQGLRIFLMQHLFLLMK